MLSAFIKYSKTSCTDEPIVQLAPRLIVKAFNQALLSTGVGPGRMRMGAILFKGKYVYAAKPNLYKTHTLLSRYSIYPYMHAESSVLIHYGLDNCAHKDILVVRINKNDELTMARPCTACGHIMHDCNISSVYYSDWQGNIRQYKEYS